MACALWGLPRLSRGRVGNFGLEGSETVAIGVRACGYPGSRAEASALSASTVGNRGRGVLTRSRGVWLLACSLLVPRLSRGKVGTFGLRLGNRGRGVFFRGLLVVGVRTHKHTRTQTHNKHTPTHPHPFYGCTPTPTHMHTQPHSCPHQHHTHTHTHIYTLTHTDVLKSSVFFVFTTILRIKEIHRHVGLSGPLVYVYIYIYATFLNPRANNMYTPNSRGLILYNHTRAMQVCFCRLF